MSARGLLILWPLLLCSCAHLEAPRELADDVQLEPHYALYEAGEAAEARPWWTQFASAELNGVVNEALTQGFSIQQAWARLQQADAVAIRDRAARRPSLGVEALARQTEREESTAGASGDTFSLALAASYELDLWGRVRAAADAAAYEASAAEGEFQTAALSLSAEVVEAWLDVVEQRTQLRIANAQAKTNRDVLDLLQTRFRVGAASAVDVYQQEQVLAGVEGTIPKARAAEGAAQMRLAVLTGRPPRGLELTSDSLPALPRTLRAGVPADLLAQRPDIRAAGMRLHAAERRIDAARADRLPAIRLSADVGYSAPELADLFDNWVANLAGNLAAPLLDGGRRRAEVGRTEAVLDERLAAYRATVYGAVREVETALLREREQELHLAALERQLAAARNALREAESRYRNGVTDYLPVLTQLLSSQRLERTLLSEQAAWFRFRVALCRALGGTPISPADVLDPLSRQPIEEEAP